ncbi:uncharacterized protein LOC123557641 [Mercenaria mercenaria]|uniref:uncharacterized protein LOC123557641 n=1 Tax=Mercenaria mercenaria TaxID=6596 RepID=UPI00234E5B6E|nr:uncharacterized protein LOC123557641 [Mercenaria mercenaria]
MQIFSSVYLFVFLTSSSFAYKDGPFEVEKLTEEFEDILIVKNISGKTVAVIEVFQDDEYQLVKPVAEDDYVCFVSRFRIQEKETTTCYESIPLPTGVEDQIDLTECEDRDIIFLRPIGCEKNDVKREDDNDSELKRQKRGCYTKQEVKSVCVEEEKYCKRYGWWFGSGTCESWDHRCSKYEARLVTIKDCP